MATRDYRTDEIVVHWDSSRCIHTGICLRSLHQVFNLRQTPWVDVGAAPADDITTTIEKCPSGALSYSADGVEHRDLYREPGITITRDGPYCLVGGVEVVGEEPRGEEVSREHCACCRCGASKNKPFCDGSHTEAGFEDDRN